MTATFDDFQAARAREPIMLAELHPSITVTGWAKTGGYTNVYDVAFSRFVTTSETPARKVYRRVDGVRENATDLTSQASIANVDAGTLRYFYDEANERLYVRSSSSGDPDTFTAYQVFVTLFMASTGIVLDSGIHYEPWLLGEMPSFSEFMTEFLAGLQSTAGGRLELSNASGFWHTVLAPNGGWNWDNKRVALLFGGRYDAGALGRSEYKEIVTALVESIAADELQASLALKPLPRLADIELPPAVFTLADYPNMGQGVEGKPIPIGYGRATMRPYLTDTTTSQGKWTVADANYQTLTTVHAVVAVAKSNGARTTLTVTTDYTVNTTACTITVVNATYNYASYDLEVDVTGKNITTFAPLVEDMLTAFVGVTSSQLDTATFDQVEADETKELAVWLVERRTLAEIFACDNDQPSLSRSVLGQVQQTVDGKWTVRNFNLAFNAETGVSLERADFAEILKGDLPLRSVFYKTTVFYKQNLATGAFPTKSATSNLTKYQSETQDQKNLYTFLRSATDALSVAQQFEGIAGGPRLVYEFVERGTKLIRSLVGDVVSLTYSPGTDVSGAFAARPFIITRLDKRPGPVPVVSGQLVSADTFTPVDPTNTQPILRFTGPVNGSQNMELSATLALVTPGTYTLTVDEDITVIVRGVAGGGGGEGPPAADPDGGQAGGGGAANATGVSVALTDGTVYTAIVGAAGASGSQAAGTDGGQTKFQIQSSTVYLQLEGGKADGTGGAATTGASGVAGGAGGAGGTSGNPGANGTASAGGAGGGGGGGGADGGTGQAGGNGGGARGGTGGAGQANGGFGDASAFASSPATSGAGGGGGGGGGVQVTGASGYYGAGGGGGGGSNDVNYGLGGGWSQGVVTFEFVSAP